MAKKTVHVHQLTGCDIDGNDDTITLIVIDKLRRETSIRFPRGVFEEALPRITLALASLDHPDGPPHANAIGLEFGVAQDGAIQLHFNLAPGTPFRVSLPPGAAQMLFDGLGAALGSPPTSAPTN